MEVVWNCNTCGSKCESEVQDDHDTCWNCGANKNVPVVTTPDVMRPKLMEALRIEFDVQRDGRFAYSSEFVVLLSKSILKNDLWKHGSGLMNLAAKHPLSALAVGVVSAVLAADTMSNYKNYITDNKELPFAFQLLIWASDEKLNDLNLTVVGGLARLLQETIINTFQTRIEALNALGKEDSDPVISQRINAYENGMSEARTLLAILGTRLGVLETRKAEDLIQKQKLISAREQEINKLSTSLENRYKAGLLTRDEFKQQTRELIVEKVAGKVVSFGHSLDKKIKNESMMSGLDEDAEYYCNRFFPRNDMQCFHVNPNNSDEGKSTLAIVIAVFIIFVLVIIISGQN